MKKKLLFLVMIALCNYVQAASFDCSKTDTKVEEIVCANKWLSNLDSQLATAYQLAANNAPPGKRRSLIAKQRWWIKTVRNKCGDADCLIRAYASRLRALTFITTGKSRASFVVNSKEQQEVIAGLQDDLGRTGITTRFSGCKYIVTLKKENYYGQDESFGAICLLNKRPVEVCDDTLVGKLTINFGSFVWSGGDVADFTEANCPPGG